LQLDMRSVVVRITETGESLTLSLDDVVAAS